MTRKILSNATILPFAVTILFTVTCKITERVATFSKLSNFQNFRIFARNTKRYFQRKFPLKNKQIC